MTRNEQIAEKCGWVWPITEPGFCAYLSDIGTDTPAGHWLMHLMVQKLVGEDLEVVIRIYGKNYGAMAMSHVYHNDPEDIETHCHGSVNRMPSAPAAVAPKEGA